MDACAARCRVRLYLWQVPGLYPAHQPARPQSDTAPRHCPAPRTPQQPPLLMSVTRCWTRPAPPPPRPLMLAAEMGWCPGRLGGRPGQCRLAGPGWVDTRAALHTQHRSTLHMFSHLPFHSLTFSSTFNICLLRVTILYPYGFAPPFIISLYLFRDFLFILNCSALFGVQSRLAELILSLSSDLNITVQSHIMGSLNP